MTELHETLTELMLNKPEVSFTYIKADGSERKARGTWKLELMEGWMPAKKDEDHDNTADALTKGYLFKYFDLDAGGWRSFHKDALKTILPDK